MRKLSESMSFLTVKGHEALLISAFCYFSFTEIINPESFKLWIQIPLRQEHFYLGEFADLQVTHDNRFVPCRLKGSQAFPLGL